MISIFYTVLPKFLICFNFDSCWRKFEMIESKFPLSGQLDMNKNKRKATVTINLAVFKRTLVRPHARWKKRKRCKIPVSLAIFYVAEHDLNNYADRGGCFPPRSKGLQNNTYFKTSFKLSSRLYLAFSGQIQITKGCQEPIL